MLRLLFFGFIGYIIYGLLRRLVVRSSYTRKVIREKPAELGEMVSCAKCGTFILKKDAVKKRENLYCSDDCSSQ